MQLEPQETVKMTEKSGLASISDLTRLTRVDRATIGKRLQSLTWVEGKKGAKMYDPVLAIPLILQKPVADLDDAKERKASADAEKSEILVQRMRGELVPVEDMKRAAAELLKSLHQRIVRISPAIIASNVIGLKDVTEIEVRIRAELSPIFDELRNLPENFISMDTSEDNEDENN